MFFAFVNSGSGVIWRVATSIVLMRVP